MTYFIKNDEKVIPIILRESLAAGIILIRVLNEISEFSGGHNGMKGKTNCESCLNYIYNDEYEYYVCQIDLDEDEMRKFLGCSFDDCPYFQFNDEYKIVRKQN